MKKIHRGAACILTAAAMACSAFGLAACGGGDYADYINPGSSGTPSTTPGVGSGYLVNIKSEGGLNLDGVMVHAKKDGKTVATGYSRSGKIQFDIAKDDYEFVVDENNLPAGYYVPEGAHYTTPETGNETTIYLPSRIIETTVGNGVIYTAGQVMNTFSFVDTYGVRHSLTELAQGKKLVVLNFWATWCGPCVSEFAALREAYTAYSDVVEVIALSIESTDTTEVIRKFYSDNNLNFYMGQDSSNLYNHFNASGIPLTIFIDRYGVIANTHNASIPTTAQWAGLFATYTSDNYVQNPETSGGDDEVYEREKPDVSSADPSDLERAAVSSSSSANKFSDFGEDMSDSDKEYNWPWIPEIDGDREYLAASNAGKKNSYSMITANVKMNSGDILSYEYNISIDSNDLFIVILDNTVLKQYTGSTNGWVTESNAYVATHDIEVQIVFAYTRGQSAKLADEIAAIDNLKIVHASEAGVSVDIPVAMVSGNLQENGKYEVYGEVYLDSTDGYYHDKATGNLVLADLLNATLWTSHVSGRRFTGLDNNEYTSTLYMLSYYLMSNYQQVDYNKGIALKFDYGDTDVLIENYYLQLFSDTEYVPLTEALRQHIIEFTKAYCAKYGKDYYEDQWLEFCYIFKHYGDEHEENEVCYEYTDPTEARTRHSAYVATEGQLNKVNITHASNYNGGGIYYKFVPSQTGVYKFTSSENVYKNDLGDTVTSDPALYVEDENGNILYWFDDDLTFSNLFNDSNFTDYGVLQSGKTYYLHCIMSQQGTTGKYSFEANYIGDSFAHMIACSDGSWATQTEYNAIEVALGSDGYYHHVENGELKSIVYLDFIHQNFFDSNGHSVIEMVNNGLFNLITIFGLDFTADMQDYYNMSIEGKDESDELYGLMPVDEDLCNILVYFGQVRSIEGDGKASNLWLSMCCYYVYYSI